MRRVPRNKNISWNYLPATVASFPFPAPFGGGGGDLPFPLPFVAGGGGGGAFPLPFVAGGGGGGALPFPFVAGGTSTNGGTCALLLPFPLAGPFPFGGPLPLPFPTTGGATASESATPSESASDSDSEDEPEQAAIAAMGVGVVKGLVSTATAWADMLQGSDLSGDPCRDPCGTLRDGWMIQMIAPLNWEVMNSNFYGRSNSYPIVEEETSSKGLPTHGWEESIVHTGTWSIVQRKPMYIMKTLVWIIYIRIYRYIDIYIHILSASSFNHPSELQLTCLDLHEINFQSSELATGPTFTHLQSTPSTRHTFIHFSHGFPSRDFTGIQVALSVANHCWTTAWSEVPRWTRSCWVRISLGVSAIHQPHVT